MTKSTVFANASGSGRSASGFTLMELLVVVAIVGILAGLVSTAMVRMMRQAARSRTDNQISQIYAAIMEYRHTYGKWPVPDTDVPTEFIDSGDRRGIWKLKYCTKGKSKAVDDNAAVIEFLLRTGNTGAGRPKRDILDLHGFSGVDSNSSTVKDSKNASSATYTEWGDAWEMSEPDDEGLIHDKVPTLVWKDRQYYCDVCENFSTTPLCKRQSCNYYKEHKAYRKLSSSSVREVAKPFYIMFDFSNDRALVQRNPE